MAGITPINKDPALEMEMKMEGQINLERVEEQGPVCVLRCSFVSDAGWRRPDVMWLKNRGS